jgi:hypothetical protein
VCLTQDKDGKLSKTEFMEGSKDDPLIVESLNLYAGLI